MPPEVQYLVDHVSTTKSNFFFGYFTFLYYVYLIIQYFIVLGLPIKKVDFGSEQKLNEYLIVSNQKYVVIM